MNEKTLCGATFNATGDPTCNGCCGGVVWQCDQQPGHVGAHYSDGQGVIDDGTQRTAVLRWRSTP